MAEKERIEREQRRKLQRYERCRRFLGWFLFAEILIVWICNPNIIPGISQWVAEVKSFLGWLLWPQDMAELDMGTYRAYIYYFWTWIEGWEYYWLLKMVVPWIIPVWFAVTNVQICVARFRIRRATEPPKEKKQRQPKQPKELNGSIGTRVFIGPRVSGLYTINSMEAGRRFDRLQECCTPLREKSAVPEADRGLWVSNQARGAGGKFPPDRIYPWDGCGKIEIKHKGDVLRFKLYSDGPRLCALGNDLIRLEKGVPLTIAHNNEAGNEIVDMTITWLGGIG